MNLLSMISSSKEGVSTQNLFKAKGTAILTKINKDCVLTEHQSMTRALVILISGKVIYEEKNRLEALSQEIDFVHIPEKVIHKVSGMEDSLMLLIR